MPTKTKASEDSKSLTTISRIQAEVGKLAKDKKNPYFNSNYTDINGLLEQLLPVLHKYGVTVIQPIQFKLGRNVLATKVYENNKLIASGAIELPNIDDPQKIGSAITYYRRYSLQSLFLLQAEDDDGNMISAAKVNKSGSSSTRTNQSDPSAPQCPKCGKNMAKRTRKSDGNPFWGCTGFPSCNGIVDFKAVPTVTPDDMPEDLDNYNEGDDRLEQERLDADMRQDEDDKYYDALMES